jgi:hypothetical protein
MKLKKITECSGAFINDRERSPWGAVNVRSYISFFFTIEKIIKFIILEVAFFSIEL